MKETGFESWILSSEKHGSIKQTNEQMYHLSGWSLANGNVFPRPVSFHHLITKRNDKNKFTLGNVHVVSWHVF